MKPGSVATLVSNRRNVARSGVAAIVADNLAVERSSTLGIDPPFEAIVMTSLGVLAWHRRGVSSSE